MHHGDDFFVNGPGQCGADRLARQPRHQSRKKSTQSFAPSQQLRRMPNVAVVFRIKLNPDAQNIKRVRNQRSSEPRHSRRRRIHHPRSNIIFIFQIKQFIVSMANRRWRSIGGARKTTHIIPQTAHHASPYSHTPQTACQNKSVET